MASGDGEGITKAQIVAIWGVELEEEGKILHPVGDCDFTTHIALDNIIEGIDEETTFNNLGEMVKQRIHEIIESHKEQTIQNLIVYYKNPENFKNPDPKAEKQPENPEEHAAKQAEKMVTMLKNKFATDMSTNAVVFRPKDNDDEIKKVKVGKKTRIIAEIDDLESDTFDLHDESNKVLDCCEADDEDPSMTTIFLYRMKNNQDLENMIGESAKQHKGGWEQSLIDAANAAIEARKM